MNNGQNPIPFYKNMGNGNPITSTGMGSTIQPGSVIMIPPMPPPLSIIPDLRSSGGAGKKQNQPSIYKKVNTRVAATVAASSAKQIVNQSSRSASGKSYVDSEDDLGDDDGDDAEEDDDRHVPSAMGRPRRLKRSKYDVEVESKTERRYANNIFLI